MALPFTGVDDVNAAIALGQYDDYQWQKLGPASIAAGVWCTTWNIAGAPGAGSTDSGGTQYVNGSGGSGASANKGGLVFAQTNVSPMGRVGLEFGVSSSQITSAILADRLCAIGPITVSTAGSQALITMPALPRYTNGLGVEVWLEVTTAFATTAGTFFLDSYTGTSNPAATSAGSTNVATAASATIRIGNMIGPLPLLAPDLGVTAVASFNVGTAPSAGAVNVVLLRRLATLVPVQAPGAASRNLLAQIISAPVIPDGSSLFIMYQSGITTAAQMCGNFVSAYK